MREYVTCSSCGRYISIEEIEAPCQLCGRDICSHCLRVCTDCGKEVCPEHWSGGKCIICERKSWVSAGYEKYKSSEGGGGKAVGIGVMAAGALETVRHHYRLKEDKKRRELGDELYTKIQLNSALIIGVFFSLFIPFFYTGLQFWKLAQYDKGWYFRANEALFSGIVVSLGGTIFVAIFKNAIVSFFNKNSMNKLIVFAILLFVAFKLYSVVMDGITVGRLYHLP